MSSPRTPGRRYLPSGFPLPDGTTATSDQPDLAQILSKALGREVRFAEAPGERAASAATAEEYWPDIEGLHYRDTVTDWKLPPGTSFDLAIAHLLTTACGAPELAQSI